MNDNDAQQPTEPPGKSDEPATVRDRAVGRNAGGPGQPGDQDRQVGDDERHRDAHDRSRPFPPIVGEREVSRFELFFKRYPVRARIGLVLVTSRGEYHTFLPEHRSKKGKLPRQGAGRLYEVDMGLHQAGLEFDLPSREEAFPFHTVVDVEWRVIDPARVVWLGLDDVCEALGPPLHHRLSTITRQFNVEDTAAAEAQAITSLTNSPIGADYGLWCRVFLRMRMDDPTITHAAEIREVRRQIELEHETQELKRLREISFRTFINSRVEHYRAIMLAGDYDQFALQLALNRDDAPVVVQMLRNEHHDDRRNAVDFVTRLLDSGAIDRYEINDQVRAALDWLKEATDTVLKGPEQRTRVASQRDPDALSPADLPVVDLPDPPRVDSVRPPGDAPAQGNGTK